MPEYSFPERVFLPLVDFVSRVEAHRPHQDLRKAPHSSESMFLPVVDHVVLQLSVVIAGIQFQLLEPSL